ncbi:uncharacterized protein LOC141607855 [Silene latifolia]|uniref:uncharacterized protein LOC141607855 n=1 Tax=Silene latifolia TaxID=37657 RepID=UPI003D77CCE1
MVYAFNEGTDRIGLWNCLNNYAAGCTDPWAIVGDFNTVMNPDERLGGQTKPEDMEAFVDFMNNCDMVDIQATGAFFTWMNKQDDMHRKYSRLDHFLINSYWTTIFPEMVGHFYPEGVLDHTSCVVYNNKLTIQKNRSFKYFSMWSGAAEFLPKVQEVWDRNILGTKMFCIVKKLKELKTVLKELNKTCYADIEVQTVETEKELNTIQLQLSGNPTSSDLISQEIGFMENSRDFVRIETASYSRKPRLNG